MRRGPKTEPKRHIDADSLPPHGPKRVTHFIETYCRVPKGTKTVPAGSPVVLRPWQKDILNGLYSDPRPRQGLVSVARKNGKTLLAACLALYHLVADDEASAEILVVSSDERTAQVTFKLARRMVELDDTLRECIQVWKEQLYIPRTDCIMEVLSGDASRAQGRNPSFAIVDEVHVTDPDCWDALALGQATRARPLILGISTECGPNEPENLMARLVGHGRNANDPDFFFREFTAPANCDTHDRRAWESANPQLYDTLDADHLAALVRTTRESQFRRYHLNQRVATEGAWLPLGAWVPARCSQARTGPLRAANRPSSPGRTWCSRSTARSPGTPRRWSPAPLTRSRISTSSRCGSLRMTIPGTGSTSPMLRT